MTRSKDAFRPGTKQNHQTMINTYTKFCKEFNRRAINPSTKTILCYLEYQTKKMQSPKTVNNYWSAVKFLHILLKAPFDRAEDIEIRLMLKSISLTKRHISHQMLPLTKKHIASMCAILDTQGDRGLVVKTALLIGFFAFLRVSNLCPARAECFDSNRNFTRGDVKITGEGLELNLKWAKNMQSALQPKKIPIPKVPQSSIDPVRAFTQMSQRIVVESHKPLFMLDRETPLTEDRLRKVFGELCRRIGLSEKDYSLHSLRRGGATQAYVNGAKPLEIKRHGAWASDCFLNYVAPDSSQNSSVCVALRN